MLNREAAISATHETPDRSRLLANGRTCRSLRHDLSAPLSAAALHLEVASRGLGQLPGDVAERIRGSVRTSQKEIEYAAWMIDILSEIARGSDQVWESFELGLPLEKAIARSGPGLAARGLRVVRSSAFPPVPLRGNANAVEQALTDVLSGAAALAAPGECRITCERYGTGAAVIVRVGINSPVSSCEALFRLSRRMDGSPSGFGLFLARWTFESLGGRLDAATDGATLAFTAATPAGDS